MATLFDLLNNLGLFLQPALTGPGSITDIEDLLGAWMRYFVNGLFALFQNLNVWTDQFGLWTWSTIQALWKGTLVPALATLQTLAVKGYELLGAVYFKLGPALADLVSFSTVGVPNALGALLQAV